MKKTYNYPRPQFVRNNWTNLNGEWDFTLDDEKIGEQKEFFKIFPKDKKINVPYTYETKMSGINDQSVHENIWYLKNVDIKEIKNKYILHFEGSDFITKLWINGKYVGMNIGGYHRFSFDITKCLIEGNNNFTIKVEDSLSKSQPRGKQRYKNESWKCWYVQTTGIWKTIWLEEVPNTYIISSKLTPNYDENNVKVELLTNINEDTNANYELETEILFDNRIINIDKRTIEKDLIKYVIDIKDNEVKHWSPETPNLYDINYKLYKDGELIDEVSSYFGMRKISIDKDKLLLNDKEIYLKMLLDQGYWAESGLTPPNEEALIKDIELVKEYGFNGIRKHQKIEDERFLYYCDINGILVWSEMANCYEFNDISNKYFTDEWQKVVEQNYNHPSIITWVPINESWGIPEVSTNIEEQQFTEKIYNITKSLDITRPVICNDGWQHTIADIITIHDYKQSGEELYNVYNSNLDILNNEIPHNGDRKLFSEGYKYNGQPIIMSEYGGIALNSELGWGYGKQVKDENEFIERFEALTNAIKNTKYICGYCYTQLTDVQQEINGLVDENRNPKFSDRIIDKIRKINKKL